MKSNKKIGLSLSGGGYRATIYHLGTLRKLREMNILENVDVISTISGGSITGAYFGLNGQNFEEFDKDLRGLVKRSIIKGIYRSFRFISLMLILLIDLGILFYLSFTKYAFLTTPLLILTIFVLFKFQFKIFPVSKIINGLYSKWFFEGKALIDLPKYPIIAINATNIETGTPFTFSRNKMSDSAYEFPKDKSKPIKFITDKFPISLAVASSTCVPFAFTPIHIDKEHFENSENYDRIKPCLVDGGVYDNQGVHKLTFGKSSYVCDIVIVSDAGDLMPRINSFTNVIQLLIRTSDIFMNRIKNYQMIQHIFDNYKYNKKLIAYQSLGWDFNDCIKGFMDNLEKGAILESVIEAHGISKEEIENSEWEAIQRKLELKINYPEIQKKQPTEIELKIARSVTTNLKSLKNVQINALIKQAECMTEIQIKLYCPQLIY